MSNLAKSSGYETPLSKIVSSSWRAPVPLSLTEEEEKRVWGCAWLMVSIQQNSSLEGWHSCVTPTESPSWRRCKLPIVSLRDCHRCASWGVVWLCVRWGSCSKGHRHLLWQPHHAREAVSRLDGSRNRWAGKRTDMLIGWVGLVSWLTHSLPVVTHLSSIFSCAV